MGLVMFNGALQCKELLMDCGANKPCVKYKKESESEDESESVN